MEALLILVNDGLMDFHSHPLCARSEQVFAVTDRGRELALRTRPRVSRSWMRYSRFLDAKDCNEDLTFQEPLTVACYTDER
jgi:hypothetical protein